jgi:hypothetical protein
MEHLRAWSRDDMLWIVAELQARARAGRVVRLTPATAYLAARGVRALARVPTRDVMLAALCRRARKGLCARNAMECYACLGLANAALQVLENEPSIFPDW